MLRQLALAIMDVDWFKAYNDLYGHPAGDACLRQIAQTLAATLARSADFVARYGGEGFVFLAPGTELDIKCSKFAWSNGAVTMPQMPLKSSGRMP